MPSYIQVGLGISTCYCSFLKLKNIIKRFNIGALRFPHNDKFDAQVRASEERIANWFAENRKVTDTFYELLDFTKKHKSGSTPLFRTT